MGFERRFAAGLALRVGFLVLALAALAASLYAENLGAARIVAALLALFAAALLWRFVQRTNVELARFIEAMKFGDYTARFSRPDADSGFDELGAALDAGIRMLREERSRVVDEQRFFESIVDDAPAALLTIDAEGRITPVSKVARRLFARHSGVRAEDYAVYGDAFAYHLADPKATSRQMITLMLDNGPQRAMVRTSALQRLGGTTRVVGVQPIQDALNAVELAAQSDLIRVLTHEIMNSMTPVTSLARTAAGLMAEVDTGENETIADAHAAVETLARRADGVMHFVETYRQISRPPQIRRRHFAAEPFAAELRRLFEADWPAERAALSVSIEPPELMIDADPDLLAQVLINLLRNAAEAGDGQSGQARIALRIAALSGVTTAIEVEDNGPGIPEALRGDVFLPFFTTKAKGTGVGLSFARQVVLAHDGSISVEQGADGGAKFRIVI